MRCRFWVRCTAWVLLLLGGAGPHYSQTEPDSGMRAALPAGQTPRGAAPPPAAYAIPASETLSYQVEWRLIHAGNAQLSWGASNGRQGWGASLKLESVGLVSRLYKVNNEYSLDLDQSLCAVSSLLKTNEGSKHRETSVAYDREREKASYLERDVARNTVVGSHEIDIPGCVHDVIGALYRLRSLELQVGESAELPLSDGKKSVLARVEAQEREVVKLSGASYRTVRYEAFLFNNVLYRRRGRLFVWLTDDPSRLPVQIQVRLPFYIGSVTLHLASRKNAQLAGSVTSFGDTAR